MTSALLRGIPLVGAPLSLAVVLWWHPGGGDPVYEGIRDDVNDWLFVHVALLFFMPLLGIAAFLLLRDLEGRAATVSRVAIVLFLVFYTAYEVTIGVGTGLLVDYANDLPAAEQAVVADAIQDYNRNWIVAEPASVSMIVGFFGWVVAMFAGAFAFRRAGAGWPITVLVGGAALFAIHPAPIGPVGLVCFVAAAVLVERGRARDAQALRGRAAPGDVAPEALAT